METPTYIDYAATGVVSLARLDANGVQVTPFRPIGNVPGFTLKQEIEKGQTREAMSGLNTVHAEWVKRMDVSYTLEVQNFDKKAYELYTSGTLTAKTSITPVTGRVLVGSATLTSDDRFDLGAMKVTAVTIKDSSATPKTLTPGTHYALDADTGIVTLLNITTGGPFTGPLKADFTPGVYDEIKGMTTPSGLYALLFEGLNLATNKREKRIFGKVTIPPASEIACINPEEGAKVTLEGAVLKDLNGDFFTLCLLP